MTLRTVIGLAFVGLIGLYVVIESWIVEAREEEELNEARRSRMRKEDEA